MNLSVNDHNVLGSAWIQPPGDGPPPASLLIVLTDRYGVQLHDRDGIAVTPRSRRLDRRHSIVCDDDVSDATVVALTASGYANVIRRG